MARRADGPNSTICGRIPSSGCQSAHLPTPNSNVRNMTLRSLGLERAPWPRSWARDHGPGGPLPAAAVAPHVGRVPILGLMQFGSLCHPHVHACHAGASPFSWASATNPVSESDRIGRIPRDGGPIPMAGSIWSTTAIDLAMAPRNPPRFVNNLLTIVTPGFFFPNVKHSRKKLTYDTDRRGP